MLHDSDENDVIDLGAPMRNFQFPPTGGAGPSLGADLLINRRKVSGDSGSLISGSSSSRSASEYSDTDGDSISLGGGAPSRPSRPPAFGGGGGDDDDDDEEDVMADEYGGSGSGDRDSMSNRLREEKARMEAEMNEKREILYQLDRLESKGHRIPRKFTLQNSLDEMRTEYHRLVREKEVDASIRFQRKMLVGLVTGVEFMNTKFDPFDLKLDGFSESVHENVTDYDDIFEELHEKYKSTGKKMAPELRLMMSLSGSAFMFHLTNSMFKAQPLPGVEEVLRSNPDLMRQFQQAAAQKAMGGAAASPGGGSGIFGMLGNMFGLNNPPPQSKRAPMPMARPPPPGASASFNQQQSQQARMSDPGDIENVINQIQGEILSRPPPTASNRFETMTVSDEDITSIIEDEIGVFGGGQTDKRGGRAAAAPRNRGRPPAGGKQRTLNI